jgi:hypothetical protein
LIREVAPFPIPVFICDSITTPSLHDGMSVDGTRLMTSVGEFFVPQRFGTPDDLPQFVALIEFCVDNDYPDAEFVKKLNSQWKDVPTDQLNLASALYTRLLELRRADRDGLWPRLLENAFAPLFALNSFDFVIGNPPWINWEAVSSDYIEQTKPLWSQYGLFSLSGAKGRLGGGKKDMSMLMTYVSIERYLKPKAVWRSSLRRRPCKPPRPATASGDSGRTIVLYES